MKKPYRAVHTKRRSITVFVLRMACVLWALLAAVSIGGDFGGVLMHLVVFALFAALAVTCEGLAEVIETTEK